MGQGVTRKWGQVPCPLERGTEGQVHRPMVSWEDGLLGVDQDISGFCLHIGPHRKNRSSTLPTKNQHPNFPIACRMKNGCLYDVYEVVVSPHVDWSGGWLLFYFIGSPPGLSAFLLVYRRSSWFIGCPLGLSALLWVYRRSSGFIGAPLGLSALLWVYRRSSWFIGAPPGLSALLLVYRRSSWFIGFPLTLSALLLVYRLSSGFIGTPLGFILHLRNRYSILTCKVHQIIMGFFWIKIRNSQIKTFFAFYRNTTFLSPANTFNRHPINLLMINFLFINGQCK